MKIESIPVFEWTEYDGRKWTYSSSLIAARITHGKKVVYLVPQSHGYEGEDGHDFLELTPEQFNEKYSLTYIK